jgi:NADH dehydrogenase
MDTLVAPSTNGKVASAKPRIVILGGGFAGMSTAQGLERRLYAADAEITLVSRENFSLFTPMLPEVSSGNLETRHVITPVRAQLNRTRFMLGDVREVDLARRTVTVEHMITRAKQDVSYDHLVFALGAVTSTFGLPGIAERALPLKTLEDAERIRNHVISVLELAAITQDDEERKRLLTFVFVGGGFTGVEAAGEMMDFFRSVLRYYRPITIDDLDVVLVEGGGKLLPDLARGMGEYSARSLVRRGVRVLVNTFVAGADEMGLQLKDGTTIPTRTIVWSAGVKPSPAVENLGFEYRRGAIVVNADFSIPGHPGLWAAGDCASAPSKDGGRVPATAQHALREGPVLAENIVATMQGKPTKPFAYESLGMMASLGARQGVAAIFNKYIISGFPAWALWRTYYLARLPGLDRQARVAFDWTLGLIFPRDIAELRVFSSRAQQRSDQEAGVAPDEDIIDKDEAAAKRA